MKKYFSFEKFCKVMGLDPEKVKQDENRAWAIKCDGAEWEKGDWMHGKDGNIYRCSPNWCVEEKKRYFSAAKWKEENKFLKSVAPWLFEASVKTFVQDCDGAEVAEDGKVIGKSGATYNVTEGIVEEKPTPEPVEKLTVKNLSDLFELFEAFNPVKKEKKEAPAKYRIVIECDGGDITNAEMVVNGKTVRKSSAKRNPADRFDFKVGAEYAFERLFKKEEKKKEESFGGFKVGDRVICINSYDGNSNIKGKKGTVRILGGEFDDDLIAVEFDEDVEGHDFAGRVEGAKDNRCWYCVASVLKPIFKEGDRIIVQGIKDENAQWMNGKHGRIKSIKKSVPAGREGGIDGHEFVDVAQVVFDGDKDPFFRTIYIERLKHE